MKKILFLNIFILLLCFAISFSEEQKHLNLSSAISIALQNNKELKEMEKNILFARAKKSEVKAKKGLNIGMQGALRLTNKETVMHGVNYKQYLTLWKDPITGLPTFTPPSFPPPSPTYIVPANPELVSTKMSEKKQKNISLVATFPLWTFGKLEGATKIASLSEEIEFLNLKKTKLKVIYDTKQSYYNYLLSYEFLKVAEETYIQAQKHKEVAEKKYNVGLVAKFDVIRAEVEVASAKEQMIKSEKMLSLAKMGLNNVLGLPLETDLVLEPEEMQKIQEYDFEICFKTALQRRPEVKLLDIAINQTEINAKISRLLPYIGVKGEYSILSEGSTFSQKDTVSGTVFIDIPLFDNKESSAKIKQASETKEKVKISKRTLEDGIKMQIKEAILSLKESQERIITSESILKQAEEALKIAETGYREGVSTYLELTDARTSLSRAKLNRIQAIYDLKIAQAKLMYAMGEE